MSVRKLTASLFMTLAMLGVGNNAVQAQEYFPVADPFAFDPDFRWFEPIYDADLADMKPNKRANTGWYATYDRLNLYGSRPELNDANASDTKIDGGWGHRYEVGYMLPADDNGWQFNWTSLDVNQKSGSIATTCKTSVAAALAVVEHSRSIRGFLQMDDSPFQWKIETIRVNSVAFISSATVKTSSASITMS
jgi:hypothetical protein